MTAGMLIAMLVLLGLSVPVGISVGLAAAVGVYAFTKLPLLIVVVGVLAVVLAVLLAVANPNDAPGSKSRDAVPQKAIPKVLAKTDVDRKIEGRKFAPSLDTARCVATPDVSLLKVGAIISGTCARCSSPFRVSDATAHCSTGDTMTLPRRCGKRRRMPLA